MRLRTADVCNRLARLRLWQKADEIAWVPRSQRNADLTVMLHPANARSVTCTRIENNKWPLQWVDRNVGGWNDFYEGVIDGLWQCTSVDQKIEPEAQHMRGCSTALFKVVISPLPQNVQEEYGTLESVLDVIEIRSTGGIALEHNCSSE